MKATDESKTETPDIALALGSQQVRAKLIVSSLLYIFAGLLPFLLPQLKYPNHLPIFIILNLNLWAALIFRLFIYLRRRRGFRHNPVIALESIYDAITGSFFIHYLGGINGPLFFFFALMIMLSAMNLVTFIPFVIAFEQGLFTVGEFILLTGNGGLELTSLTVIQLLLRLAFLFIMAQFSNGLAASILQERTKSEEVRQATRGLIEANLMLKSLDRIKVNLLNMASHELRTPATSIRNSLFLLEKEGEGGNLSERGRKYFESAMKASERLNNLIKTINQLLETSPADISLNISSVQLELIIEEAVEGKKPQAIEKGIELEFKKTAMEIIPEIQADEAKIKYVVWELLTNSLKYTDQGEVTIEVIPLDDFIELVVSDSGSGVPADVIENLFKEEFVKGDFFHKTQEGLGLGLYTVKRIVDLHKGRVEISSRPGQGTTVRVFLPR